MMDQLTKILLGGSSPFERSFRANEYRSISNRGGGKTLLWMSIIVGTTLAALAFGVGSLNQLEVRMDNPFTNIVDLGIYTGDREKFSDARPTILQEGRKLGLDTITQWSKFALKVLPPEQQLTETEDVFVSLLGRTVDYSSNLFDFVFQPDNVISGENFRGEDPDAINMAEKGGVIFKEVTLEKLGYERSDYEQLKAIPVFNNTLQSTYFIPVLAIVRDLPSNADFVCSFEYYASLYGKGCNQQSFEQNQEGDNIVEFVIDKRKEKELVELLAQSIPGEADAQFDSEPLAGDHSRELQVLTVNVKLPFVRQNNRFYKDLLAALETKGRDLNWIPYTRYKWTRCGTTNIKQVSFLFNKLDEIKAFRELLLEETGIEVATEIAENKENFALVSRLGNYIGLILLVFSVASICFFIRNLIEGHLNEVKPNLGTFKAFGLPDSTLIRNYQKILMALLLLAVLFGFLIAGILGLIAHWLLEDDYYDLLNIPIALALITIFSLSIVFAGIIIRKILHKSPGDLVYGRS